MLQKTRVLVEFDEPVLAPALPPVSNVFGTGINVYCFGKGFPWLKHHYHNWGEGGALLLPYLDFYRLSSGIVPDFRGMNAFVSGGSLQETVAMDLKKRLWRTAMPVDCVTLKSGQSAFAISADCHTVLLTDTLQRRALLLHCGRDALHPIRRNGTRREGRTSIIDAAMERLMPTNTREIYALTLMGIGPNSFENHTTEFHRQVVQHFVSTCGRDVVRGEPSEGRLDIPAIIRVQLNKWGVGKGDPRRIVEDGIDTFRDERFYSRRRDLDGNNCVLVDMEQAFQ